MRRIANTIARLTGLVVTLYGAWMFGINLAQDVLGDNGYDPAWVLFMVLGFGLVGTAGGVLFLLSLDGPQRFKNRRTRVAGWAGMLVSAAFPTSLAFILLPMVALSALSLFDPSLTESHDKRAELRSG